MTNIAFLYLQSQKLIWGMRVTLTILPFFMSTLSHGSMVEEVIEVPVRVTSISGQEADQVIKVTIFHDDQRKKAPYLVLHHGRPADKQDFVKMKRQRFFENSRYFVSLGFVVFVPTRVGYGESGGPDMEHSGPCDRKDFAQVYSTAANQTAAVLEAAQGLSYVDLSRGIVVGQSFGGMTSLALASRGLPGLLGAINFAGGGGGNPVNRPENPCSPNRLAALCQEFGAAAKVPTLWLYSENDRFWGPDLPKKWFKSFVDAGGKARFVQLPSHKENGHGIFTGDPMSWRPAFEEFLHDIRF